MKDLFLQAAEIQEFFISMKWDFCFIGGIALQRWGEPRLTVDIDISLLTGFGNEEPYIDALISRYRSRVKDVKKFAITNRVLLLESEDEIGIDIALSGLPFEERAVDRATSFEFLRDCSLKTCSAEDLIILKAFADRGRDWADIESVVIKQHGKLDRDYIFENLKPLCELKEEPEISGKLYRLFEKNNEGRTGI